MGVNVQLLADPTSRLVRTSPALPGAIHDLTAARQVGLIDALIPMPTCRSFTWYRLNGLKLQKPLKWKPRR